MASFVLYAKKNKKKTTIILAYFFVRFYANIATVYGILSKAEMFDIRPVILIIDYLVVPWTVAPVSLLVVFGHLLKVNTISLCFIIYTF